MTEISDLKGTITISIEDFFKTKIMLENDVEKLREERKKLNEGLVYSQERSYYGCESKTWVSKDDAIKEILKKCEEDKEREVNRIRKSMTTKIEKMSLSEFIKLRKGKIRL